jgi:SAM-dependent methyltransferase
MIYSRRKKQGGIEMSTFSDPKQFWEDKILTWENGRYGKRAERASPLERLANRASNSLRFRLEITKKLLTPYVEGKHIVELGCGSGLLAEDLISKGAASYRGYDISTNAISNARELAEKQGISDKVTFVCCSIMDLPSLKADIVFSLGLLDWLDEANLAKIFEAGGNADYLHAISEKRVTLSQYLHRLYVYLSYGWRTGSYVPQYHTVAEILALAKPHNQGDAHVYRNSRLSFCTLISTLPIDK